MLSGWWHATEVPLCHHKGGKLVCEACRQPKLTFGGKFGYILCNAVPALSCKTARLQAVNERQAYALGKLSVPLLRIRYSSSAALQASYLCCWMLNLEKVQYCCSIVRYCDIADIINQHLK